MEDTMDMPRGEATLNGGWDFSKETLKRRSSDSSENGVFASPPSTPMNESACHSSPSSSASPTLSPDSWDHRVSDVTEWSSSESVKSPAEAEPLGRHARERTSPAAILSQPHVTRFPFGKSGGDNAEQSREELRREPSYQVPERTTQRHVCRWKLCGQFFPGQRQLSTHVNDDHVRVERPDLDFHCHWQGCPRLGKGFNARYKMLIHIRTHTNEKPHACPMCGKCFSRLENLKIHTRSHTGEKPYSCTFPGCGKAYSNSSDRFKHVRTHQEEKPYKCKMPGCQKQYTDPSSLRKHVRTYGHAFGLDGALSRCAPSVEDCGEFATRKKRLKGTILSELRSKYPSLVNTAVTYEPSRTPEIQTSFHDETRGKLGSLENMDDKEISFVFLKENLSSNEKGDNTDPRVKADCQSLYKKEILPGSDNELTAQNKCLCSEEFVGLEIRSPDKKTSEIRHAMGSGLKVYTVQDINSSVCEMERETGGCRCSSPLIGGSDTSYPAARGHNKSPLRGCRSPDDRNLAADNEKKISVSAPEVSTVSLKSTQHWKKRKILCSELEQKAAASTASSSAEPNDPQLHPRRKSPHLLTQIEPKQIEPQSPDSSTPMEQQATHTFTHLKLPSPHSQPQVDQQSKLSPTPTSVIAHHSPTLSPNILHRPQESSVSMTARHCSPDSGWRLLQLTGQNDHSCPNDSPLIAFADSPLRSYTESPFSSHSTGTPPVEFTSVSTKYGSTFSPSSFKIQSLTSSTNQNRLECDFLSPHLLPNCPIYPMTQPSYTDSHRFLCSPSSAGSPPCVSLPVMFPLDQQSHHFAEHWGGHTLYPCVPSTSPFLGGSQFQDFVPARYLVSLTPILDMPPAISPLMDRLYPVNLSPYHHHHYYLQAMTYNPQLYTTRI